MKKELKSEEIRYWHQRPVDAPLGMNAYPSVSVKACYEGKLERGSLHKSEQWPSAFEHTIKAGHIPRPRVENKSLLLKQMQFIPPPLQDSKFETDV